MAVARGLSRSLNIRARLVFLCLAVATPLLIIGVFILWKEYQTLKNEARRATTFQAAICVRAVSHWITSQEEGLAALAALPAVKQRNPESLRKILYTAAHAQHDWHAVYLVSTAGRLIAASMDAAEQELPSLISEPFVARMRATGKPDISEYTQCPLTGAPAIIVGAPVLRGNRTAGFLLASVNPRAVYELFQGLGERSGSMVAVVDRNMRVVTRTLNNDFWAGRDFSQARTVQAAGKRWRGTLEVVGIADPTPRAYAFDHLTANRWVVVAGVPTAEIYGPAHDWLVLMLMLAGCAIGVSVVLACKFTAHFTAPINELVREALAIGRGDLSKRVRISSGDELGLLARAFNQMAINLELNQEQKLMVERISESIRQSLDLDEILNTAISELGKALKASRCCIALIDARSHTDLADDQLAFNYVWSDPARGGTPLKNSSILMTGESMLKMILEQGAILSMDVLDDTSFLPLFESEETYPEDWKSIKSLMACPISTRERPLGLILVHQCDERRTWIDPELELVDSVATHAALAMEQAFLYRRTKALADQQLLINHIVRAVRGSLDLDTILGTVTRELGEALSADRCQIAQPRAEGPLVVSHEYQADGLTPMIGLNIYGEKIDFDPAILAELKTHSVMGIDLSRLGETSDSKDGTTLRDAPLAVIADASADSRTLPFRPFLAAVGSRSLIAAPLLNEDRLLGLLMVHQTRSARDWKPEEAGLVTAIADQVSIAISHAQLFAQVRHQAITDGLTGLYNHIYLKNRLEKELRRAQRKQAPCSLLMLDLDRLKLINDSFGHPVGDAAIRQVAWALKNLLRSGDTAARYGGEEFAVILPETPLNEAALIADRLCRQVNSAPVPGLGTISISIGAATYPDQAEDMKELIEKADMALYVAKHCGRNQVRVFDGHSPLRVITEPEAQTTAPVEPPL